MPLSADLFRSRLIPILLAQAVGLACGIINMRLLSHLVPPALLGGYGIFLTLAPMGMWVVHAGLLKFVSRHWAAAPDQVGLARAVLRAWARRLPWLAALAALAAGLLALRGVLTVGMAWLALFFSASLLALGALTQNGLQAIRAHWRDCAIASSASLSRSFLPPLLFSYVGGGLATLVAGFGAHALIVALAGCWMLSRTCRRTPNAAPVAHAGTGVYEGPLFIALAAMSWLLTGLNRWLVAWCYGDVEAGYFTLAGGAAVIVTSLPGTVLMQYLQPGLFALGDGPATMRPALARRTDLAAAAYAAIAGLALLLLHATAPRLVGPLISPAYRDALAWIVPAGCFGIAMITGVFYHTLLLAGQRESACGPVDLGTAFLLIVGCAGSALAGREWFMRWLLITPLVPWLLTRTLARHYFFKPAATPASAPVP